MDKGVIVGDIYHNLELVGFCVDMNNPVFKAWDKKNKSMHRVVELIYDNAFGETHLWRVVLIPEKELESYDQIKRNVHITDIVLLPFTGHHDVIGNPVFRHSIIQAYGAEIPEKNWRNDNNFYVEWSEKYLCYYPVSCLFGEITQPSNYDLLHILDKGVIVGDIYHRPELVKIRK